MKFVHNYSLALFFLVAGIFLFFLWSLRYREKLLSKFAQKSLVGELILSFSYKKYKLKILLFIGAIIFLGIALMRPQWGFRWQEVKRKGVDIIIAVDTSKSMMAQDIKPNRLERAKLAIKDFVKQLKGDRVGLLAFSGDAFMQCPLTLDYSGFLLSLDELDFTAIPIGGTSIKGAIATALKGYKKGRKEQKVLIIITDGEDHQGDVMEVVTRAKQEGIKIFCIGVGTPEGELIPMEQNGKQGFLKNKDGQIVKTRLNEKLLQKAALSTGGIYVRACAVQFGLEFIYNKRISKMEKRAFKSKMAKMYEEWFQIPLLLGFLLLVLDMFITTYKDEK